MENKFSRYSIEELKKFCQEHIMSAQRGYSHTDEERITAYEAMLELQNKLQYALSECEEKIDKMDEHLDDIREDALINRAARKFVHINGMDDEFEKYFLNEVDDVIAGIQRREFRLLTN